jgi:hypothetical protein
VTLRSGDAGDNGVFVFRKQVEEVLLHATVIDDKQHIVTNLDKGDFSVSRMGVRRPSPHFATKTFPSPWASW